MKTFVAVVLRVCAFVPLTLAYLIAVAVMPVIDDVATFCDAVLPNVDD
jgi:phage shock protein PspC (stress-responsive transcriptional regulator)